MNYFETQESILKQMIILQKYLVKHRMNINKTNFLKNINDYYTDKSHINITKEVNIVLSITNSLRSFLKLILIQDLQLIIKWDIYLKV